MSLGTAGASSACERAQAAAVLLKACTNAAPATLVGNSVRAEALATSLISFWTGRVKHRPADYIDIN
jgi:hypothetical protein